MAEPNNSQKKPFIRFKIIHYYLVPIICLIVWWGMLIALLVAWSIQGHPIYAFMGPEHQDPVYISDIGATNLQPLFISCAGFQAIFFVGTLALDLYLREKHKLQPFIKSRQHKLAIISIICAVIGQLGILFVSIFNTKNFKYVHLSMVAIFIAFSFFACFFNFFNSFTFGNNPQLLSPYHKEDVIFGYKKWHNLYMVSFWMKAFWLVAAFFFAVLFGAFMKSGHDSTSAIFEWLISFWYGLLLVMWSIDLLPSSLKHFRINHPEIYGPNSEEGVDETKPEDHSDSTQP
ncbi:Frag1/DRAM/Sfk1 [Scheffersomyces amazonensis]|uniref:Frag1/DRAM/Sfk1 n=1 Tax=Scheffersomyces amazonensis TaxID=1078765 RepID=UPI00315DA3FC